MKIKVLLSIFLLLPGISSLLQAQDSKSGKSATELEASVQESAKKVRNACIASSRTSGTAIKFKGTVYILKCWHSVDQFPKSMERTVSLGDGTKVKIKRFGHAPHIDTALFKIIDSSNPGNIPAVELADSYETDLGDFVFTGGVACNMQLLDVDNDPPNVSLGIVSSLHNRRGTGDMIGVDAAINYGDSGGGLFTMEGKYLGLIARMNSRKWSDENGKNSFKGKYNHTGLGFCVPSNTLRHFFEKMVEQGGGRVLGGRYGAIKGLDLDFDYHKKGVRVERVKKESPASKAGFKEGDIIVNVEGLSVHRAKVFEGTVSSYPLGTPLSIRVQRNGTDKTLTAKVGMDRGRGR